MQNVIIINNTTVIFSKNNTNSNKTRTVVGKSVDIRYKFNVTQYYEVCNFLCFWYQM